jgi:CheY-like chemotaxis protein
MKSEDKYILLAEDDVHIAELMLRALAEIGYTDNVILVHDGADALDYLGRRARFRDRVLANPTVVLLDLKMPKVDGLEALQQIKSDPALRATPVVMLTSSEDERDIRRSYDLGANAYVVKPAHFQQFSSVVRQLAQFWMNVNEPPPAGAPLATAPPEKAIRA